MEVTMTIKQISVFLENKSGRINDVTKAVGKAGINMHAFSMAETTDFGILRLIVSDEVDARLHAIMENIHQNCVKYGTEADGYVNYVKGANIAGFMKVAKAMMAQGIV